MNPLVSAVFLTTGAAIVCHIALDYWRGSPRFARQQAMYQTLFRRRWLSESIPRTVPVIALGSGLVALTAWSEVLYSAEPDLPRPVVLAANIFLGLAALTVVALVPPLLLYNAPRFLVPPRERGRPGGLELRRRYGGR